MRNKPFLTTGALFMGLILVLGAIGIVNGLWSKNLVINGTVETGDLNADWDAITLSDTGLDPCTAATNPTGCVGLVSKNVGACEYVSGIGTQIAVVAITNGYPSYECTITGAVSNTGTIPFDIIGANLIINNGNELGLNQLGEACTTPADPQVDPVPVTDPLTPFEEGDVSCTVHVLQTAEQGWTYYFAIEVCVAQWNEGVAFGTDFNECKDSDQHEGPDAIVLLTAPHATP
jgi:hypothetical protein